MVKAEILEADIPPKYTRFGLAPQVFLTGRKVPKYIGSGSRACSVIRVESQCLTQGALMVTLHEKYERWGTGSR